MDISNILNIASLVVGLGTLFGAALIFGRSKAIQALQRDEIEAQGQRIETLEKENILCKASAAAAHEKASVLENIVTQTPSIEKLTKMQSDQHKEVIDQLSQNNQHLADLTAQLSKLVETMSKNAESERRRNARKPRTK